MSHRFASSWRVALVVIACGAIAGCGGTQTAPRGAAEPVGAGPAPAGDTFAGTADVHAMPAGIPAEVQAAHERATAAMARGDFATAERELTALVADWPMLPGPLVNLAIIRRQDGRDDEAEALLERAVAAAPDHPAALTELGILYRERGEFERAEAAYRRALVADPAHALAHYNLGVLLDLYLGRLDEALDHYETYQQLSAPADPVVANWAIDLRRRLGLPTAAERIAQEGSR